MSVQPVTAAPTYAVEQRDPTIVGAEKPRRGTQRSLPPSPITGDVVREGTGFGHDPGFDRLLVEARARLAMPPAPDGREAEVLVDGLNIDQPAEQAKAAGEQPIHVE